MDNLPQLNMPYFEFKTRNNGAKNEIFDIARKKYVALTPEEWVRQHVVHYLHFSKNYPLELIQVEGSITFNKKPKRCDIIVYNKEMKPKLLVECKNSNVALTQKTFDQASLYNIVLEVPYLLITNGLQHICFSLDQKEKKFLYHKEIPEWTDLEY